MVNGRDLQLKDCVLDNEEYSQYIHERLDLLGILGAEIDNNIRDDTNADTIRNAVSKRHNK